MLLPRDQTLDIWNEGDESIEIAQNIALINRLTSSELMNSTDKFRKKIQKMK